MGLFKRKNILYLIKRQRADVAMLHLSVKESQKLQHGCVGLVISSVCNTVTRIFILVQKDCAPIELTADDPKGRFVLANVNIYGFHSYFGMYL